MLANRVKRDRKENDCITALSKLKIYMKRTEKFDTYFQI